MLKGDLPQWLRGNLRSVAFALKKRAPSAAAAAVAGGAAEYRPLQAQPPASAARHAVYDSDDGYDTYAQVAYDQDMSAAAGYSMAHPAQVAASAAYTASSAAHTASAATAHRASPATHTATAAGMKLA